MRRERQGSSPRATSSVPVHDRLRSAKAAASAPDKDHIHLHLDHLDADHPRERLPGISESARIFRRRRRDPRADPGSADGALQHGWRGNELSAARCHLAQERMAIRRHHFVPRAAGECEAACVSVHGANRLGSNSLIDLVVFGRGRGPQVCRDHRARAVCQQDLPGRCRLTRARIARLDHLPPCRSGGTPTAELRLRTCSEIMQESLRRLPHWRRSWTKGVKPNR